ncbi:MICOS complex subunit mic25a isoform X2 [Electrophorus electricus]|uniref:MICOS complex subunit mic25a isoform X2 n=1 Tax=Electrophorus electricus TaxID=8005 RepID=UPI0015CFB79C|nr:MICOS complex subunit mic25a isoform X2 [Electrophorus electricus]
MGSSESATRKVSFGLDEDERVQVVRGVKLSEDVLQRMRNASRAPTNHKENSVSHTQPSKFQQSTGPTVSENMEDLKRRYEREQVAIQEELARIARKEREAVRQDVNRAMQREKFQTLQEAERARQLPSPELDAWAKQLETKETELKALEAFYREQIDQLEKRNLNHFKTCKEQFHAAADRVEANIKVRGTEPVCADLQSRVLRCYRENREQTLRCSDLARDYMRCVNAAKQNHLVNHG